MVEWTRCCPNRVEPRRLGLKRQLFDRRKGQQRVYSTALVLLDGDDDTNFQSIPPDLGILVNVMN